VSSRPKKPSAESHEKSSHILATEAEVCLKSIPNISFIPQPEKFQKDIPQYKHLVRFFHCDANEIHYQASAGVPLHRYG